MGIIFDLDQTLVDTKFIEPYRKTRDWSAVRRLIPQVRAYPGIDELMREVKTQNIPVAIVTNSPDFYVDQILVHLGWCVDYQVCYHDVPRGKHKPDPFPIQKAVENLGVTLASTHSFGDRDIDVISSKRAGVKAAGCLWGCDDAISLRQSNPDVLLKTPDDLRAYIHEEFSFSQ